jgi:small subunit ribosomal protein S20
MPQRRNAIKRLRIDKKRTIANASVKSDLKKVLKGFKALIAQGKPDQAKTELPNVYRKIDRAASKGILHKNTASRRKAVLAAMLLKKA